MNTIQLRQMYDTNTNFQLELVYKGICKMLEDHPFMYAEFRKDMANNIQQIQGEVSFTPQGRSIIGAYLSKLENSAQSAPQPEVGGDVIPQFDNWMRSNPSPLLENTRAVAIKYIENIIEWLLSYDNDFVEEALQMNNFLLLNKKAPIKKFLEEVKKLHEMIIPIYSELIAPIKDVRSIAIEAGSTYVEMDEYIRQLVKEKKISKTRAEDLRDIYGNATNKSVGVAKLRIELKNIQ